MRDKGFDQLPVESPKSHSLVGLVTLGNLLSYMASGRASPDSPVKDVMFDFTTLPETVIDPTDMTAILPTTDDNAKVEQDSESRRRPKRKGFVEITRDTPLSKLSRFFEWNSAAIVTERDNEGHIKPVAVVTKVDLLTWLVKMRKLEAANGA